MSSSRNIQRLIARPVRGVIAISAERGVCIGKQPSAYSRRSTERRAEVGNVGVRDPSKPALKCASGT